MTANRFLIISLVSFLATLGVYAVLVDRYVIIEREVPAVYGQYLLESVSELSGKVIIDSGSNSRHAIDPYLLAAYFDAPIISVADRASYPLRPKILNLNRFTKPGDIIILPLELNKYVADEAYSEKFVKGTADRDLHLEFYFNSMPILEKLKFIFQRYPVSEVWSGLRINRDTGILAREDIQRLYEFEKYLNSDSATAFGLHPRDGPEEANLKSQKLSCDEYIFEQQLQRGFIISDTFKDNLKLLKTVMNRGVAVYFVWPAVVDQYKSQCYMDSDIMSKAEPYLAEIKSLIEQHGIVFLGDFRDSRFPSSCFLNTYYHLRWSCAQDRTKNLIETLEARQVGSVGSALGQSDIIDKVQTAIQKKRDELLQKQYGDLISLGSGSVEGEKLSERMLLLQGWYKQAMWGLWSSGNESRIILKLDDNLLHQEFIVLRIAGRYFGESDKTRVEINGMLHGDFELLSKEFQIRTDSVVDGRIDIRLYHSNIASPAELGLGKGNRKIKYGLESISLR